MPVCPTPYGLQWSTRRSHHSRDRAPARHLSSWKYTGFRARGRPGQCRRSSRQSARPPRARVDQPADLRSCSCHGLRAQQVGGFSRLARHAPARRFFVGAGRVDPGHSPGPGCVLLLLKEQTQPQRLREVRLVDCCHGLGFIPNAPFQLLRHLSEVQEQLARRVHRANQRIHVQLVFFG
jgi:hypothetical protein